MFAKEDHIIKGLTTIEGIGLNRVELEARRSVFLEKLKRLYKVAMATPERPESREALEYLETCAAKEGEFSSMVKANLQDGLGAIAICPPPF